MWISIIVIIVLILAALILAGLGILIGVLVFMSYLRYRVEEKDIEHEIIKRGKKNKVKN